MQNWKQKFDSLRKSWFKLSSCFITNKIWISFNNIQHSKHECAKRTALIVAFCIRARLTRVRFKFFFPDILMEKFTWIWTKFPRIHIPFDVIFWSFCMNIQCKNAFEIWASLLASRWYFFCIKMQMCSECEMYEREPCFINSTLVWPDEKKIVHTALLWEQIIL